MEEEDTKCLFEHQINSSSFPSSRQTIRCISCSREHSFFFIILVVGSFKSHLTVLFHWTDLLSIKVSNCRLLLLYVSSLSLSLAIESLSCNQCKRTERCLPDLITNKPVCVTCKRPNGRCSLEVRTKGLTFNLFNCPQSYELTLFIIIIVIITRVCVRVFGDNLFLTMQRFSPTTHSLSLVFNLVIKASEQHSLSK